MSTNFIDFIREKKDAYIHQYDKIEELKEKGWIVDSSDLYGDGEPTIFFPHRLKKYYHLLDDNERESFSKKEMKKINRFSYFMRKLSPLILQTKQIYEDRDKLLGLPSGSLKKVNLPDEPVIFVSNHLFRDDILGTMIAADRTAYALCGSVPLFYNTLEGIIMYNSGIVLMNRKIRSSKQASIEKQKEVLKNGGSLIVYPEGAWNKSPNKLHIPLWNGVFKLSKETGVKIVPIVHYIKDPAYLIDKKDNPFHTIVDDPIDPRDYSEEQLKQIVEDKFSTWTYLMMEKYGKSKREDLFNGYDSLQQSWENQLNERIKTAKKYEVNIESKSDFRPKGVVDILDVYKSIADLEESDANMEEVRYAKRLVKELKNNDFQHRF